MMTEKSELWLKSVEPFLQVLLRVLRGIQNDF